MRRLLSLAPIISEVDPGNKSGIVDTLGNTADWLEIYNPDPTTAVNLSGWSLSYEKTGGTTSKTWTFPNNVVLGPGAFRVIFCDSNDTLTSAEDPLGELDTGFNLSKDGATLELINTPPTSTVVSTLTYPTLSSDTSYGPVETVAETDLVAAGATASYYAPTAAVANWNQPGFNAASWASGPTGLGYTGVPGFATTLYRANITVSSVATAQSVISTPSEQTSVTNETEGVLNFMDTGGGGHFGNDNPFPGMTVGAGLSNYVLQATGTITVTSAQAGYYTFGVNSDDGFSLTITNANTSLASPTFSRLRMRPTPAAATRWPTSARGVRPTPWAPRTWPRAAIRSTWCITRVGAGRAWSSMPPRRAVPRGRPPSTRTRSSWALLPPPPPGRH